MITLKRAKFLALAILFASSAYIMGCSSAESTTGKLAYRDKNWAKAETELTKGLATDKTDAEGWFMLGHAQVELGKFAAAQSSFKQSLSINNNYADEIQALWIDKYNAGITNYNNGISQLKGGNSTAANSSFRAALNNLLAANYIISDSVKVAQVIGDSYFYVGQKDSALYYYTSVIDKSKSPDDANQIARILYTSGLDALQSENWEQAVELFTKASTVPFLAKDNKYYEASILNRGLANYRIAEKLSKESGDYKPYLRNAIDALEPLTTTSKNNEILKDVYNILIESYLNLEMQAEADNARARLSAIGN